MTEKIRTRKYVPSTFIESEDHKPEYSGYVVMKMVDYDLRSILQEKARAKIPKEAIEVAAEAVKAGEEAVAKVAAASTGGALIRAMVSLLPEVVVEVKITRLDDGLEITSLDDMRYEGGLHNVLTELASVVMGKQRLTKPAPSETA